MQSFLNSGTFRDRFGKYTKKLLGTSIAALMLAVLLSACAAKAPDESLPPSDFTLPSIGIEELDPEAAATATMPESSEEDTNTDAAMPDTAAETVESSTPAEESSSKAPEETTTIPQSEEPTVTPPETTAPETTAPPETTVPETTAAPTEPETTAEAATSEAANGVRVWMGDSRFVGYSQDVSYDANRDVFISGWGKGYDWMLETAFPEFEKLAAEKHIDICYWSLGANDITNDPSDYNLELAEKYVTKLKQLMAKHPGTIFYLLSYGPVGEEGMDPNNIPDCDAYNKALWIFIDYIREHSSMIYLDQGEYIERTGFRVYDGCHYDPETNRRAFAYVLAQSGQ